MVFKLNFAGDADVTLDIDGMTVYVECKQAVGKNPSGLLNDAFKQIKRRCEGAKQKQFGIAALGLTRHIAQEAEQNGPLLANDITLNSEIKNTVSRFNLSEMAGPILKLLE